VGGGPVLARGGAIRRILGMAATSMVMAKLT
jgi:hypothetical protein